MGKFVVIEPSGKFRTVEMEKDEQGSCLAQLKKLVGGWIEHVRPDYVRFPEFDAYMDLWINEEGKLMNLDPNSVATRVSSLYGYDVLVGPCVITRTNVEGETLPLSQADAESVMARLIELGGKLVEEEA